MGVQWLSRQCSVVLYEFAAEADENPDGIAWAPGAGSVLIECKLSRSDFLRDATKTVRRKPRDAGTSREKPCSRGPVPQFDAQAGTNTNRYPAALGMAER